jgi:hypothetical protein
MVSTVGYNKIYSLHTSLMIKRGDGTPASVVNWPQMMKVQLAPGSDRCQHSVTLKTTNDYRYSVRQRTGAHYNRGSEPSVSLQLVW